MLKKALIEYKGNCEAERRLSSRFMSMFRVQYDYEAKINAVSKLIMDIELTDVMYTQRDIETLSRGKLAKLLNDHGQDLPARFTYEKKRSLNSGCW